MAEDLVVVERHNKIGILTLHNEAKRNALSTALMEQLIKELETLRASAIPVVIIRAGKNARVWCSGHDVTELPKSRRDPLGYYDAIERLLRCVETYPGAVIAMIQGTVWGGGVDLVLTCDLVVGDHTSSFAITPAKLGLPYNATGVMHFLNRLPLTVAKEMFFTAEPITAERADRVGIINHLVDSEQIESFTLNLAETMASRSALCIAVIKEQFRLLSGAHPLSPETFELIQGLRRKIYDSHDYTEGIKAFVEKRPPVFTGE